MTHENGIYLSCGVDDLFKEAHTHKSTHSSKKESGSKKGGKKNAMYITWLSVKNDCPIRVGLVRVRFYALTL